MSTELQRAAWRDANQRWRKRHPDRVKTRNASPESRECRANYEKSEKCRTYRAEYAKTPNRTEQKRVYRSTVKGRAIVKKASRAAELRQYGVTERVYQRLLRRFGGACGSCGHPPNGTSLCVDHDHSTGEIRGLLCHACNIGISKFDDDPNIMRMAIAYLERSRLRPTEI